MHLIGSTKIENEQKFAYAEKYYTMNGYIVYLDKIQEQLWMRKILRLIKMITDHNAV